MISEKTIQEAARRLVEKFNPDRIILFGSYARGTADRHSDVDLLVITRADGIVKGAQVRIVAYPSQ